MGTFPNLTSKKIILAVTGSIAAYKSLLLTRLLIKAGAEVQILMTKAATHFVSPLSFATLSRKKVHTQVMEDDAWNNHVEMGLWADAMIIAPATANTISKMANGMADSIVNAVYLSAKCPVFFAPAMDLDMWKHPSTVENIKKLKSFGNYEIEVGVGELASGLVGAGRMAEPEDIISQLDQFFDNKGVYTGKKVMITAGPTIERIDPVRFISNHSTGRMGISIANAFKQAGAEVHLILGPSKLRAEVLSGIEITDVESAEEMYEVANDIWPSSNIAVMTAAVADYKPETSADQKIKKKEGDLNIPLVRTQDIAASLGKVKREDQILIGFALETQNGIENAKMKVYKKNFDMIILNSLQDKGAGFGHTTNKVTMVHKDGSVNEFPLKSKKEVALDILKEVENSFLKT